MHRYYVETDLNQEENNIKLTKYYYEVLNKYNAAVGTNEKNHLTMDFESEDLVERGRLEEILEKGGIKILDFKQDGESIS